jgi:membrane associated rhomboid family serine protease
MVDRKILNLRAFLIAPIVGAGVLSLLTRSLSPMLFLNVLIVCYAVALIIFVPSYLLASSVWKHGTILAITLGGVAAALPYLIFLSITSHSEHAVLNGIVLSVQGKPTEYAIKQSVLLIFTLFISGGIAGYCFERLRKQADSNQSK